jgi:hypothetical protein
MDCAQPAAAFPVGQPAAGGWVDFRSAPCSWTEPFGQAGSLPYYGLKVPVKFLPQGNRIDGRVGDVVG